MKLVTREQAQLIDNISIKEHGLSSKDLMFSAAESVARVVLDLNPKFVLIVCGSGNNGGDGRMLSKILKNQKIHSRDISVEEFLEEDISDCNFIVDAIFGTGLNRYLDAQHTAAIRKINESEAFVLSVDVPSGLNCNTGWDYGACVRADLTVTFGPAKPGFFIQYGQEAVGFVVGADIGFPQEVIDQVANTHQVFESIDAYRLLPQRHLLTNKSENGRACIVAGSDGMWGASLLAARAAFRTGSGYVFIASPEDASKVINHTPEVMVREFSKIKSEKVDAFIVGPGLGEQSSEILSQMLLQHSKSQVVLDASALTALSKKPQHLPSHWLVTPHAGELSRLIEDSVDNIEFDRFAALQKFYDTYGCQILLKGSHPIHFDGSVFTIINSGNQALAKAGTGDVLAGMIGSFMAQGLTTQEACCLGAFVHGHVADLWVASGKSNLSLMASDVLDLVPNALSEIESNYEES